MEGLEAAIELTKRLGLLIYEFKDGGASQAQVEATLNEYVALLSKLTKLEGNTPVPLALLQHVDSGRHPDSYLQQRFSALQNESARAHGKCMALLQFRDELLTALQGDSEGEFKESLMALERKPKLVRLSLPSHEHEEEIVDI